MPRPKRNKKESQQNKQANVQQYKTRSLLKPKTKNQEELIMNLAENTITLAIGPAGCGKTKCAVAYGIEKLLNGYYKRLIVTRPVVEAGEHLGYLPGNFSEKIDPYLQPIYYELSHYLSKQELETFINNGINRRGENEIVIAPLAYMRGMNYHDSYMILDECQNCTKEQIKLFITRVGFNSKAVLVGDDKQSDLPNGKSGLYYWFDKLKGVKDVATFQLDKADIIRNPVISRILEKIGE
jgi:phosphate starvation-inducible protein PhoH and related proteins